MPLTEDVVRPIGAGRPISIYVSARWENADASIARIPIGNRGVARHFVSSFNLFASATSASACPTRRTQRQPAREDDDAPPTSATRQPQQLMEGNNDGKGEQATVSADITAAASTAGAEPAHVRVSVPPPTQTSVSKSFFHNSCPLNYLVS